MSKVYLLRIILLTLLMIPVILHFFSESAFSFTSADEYLTHAGGSGSCTSPQCHIQFETGEKAFRHEPAVAGECNVCHTAKAYPNKYGLEPNQSIICSGCHKSIEHEIKSSRFVHGPIKNGDCTSCHDPHGSDRKFFLKASYSKMCSLCHSLKGLYAGEFIHKPVEDGNCGLCHDPHASNFKSRLTDTGANLCLTCHEDMVAGMTRDYIHAPLIKSGCTDCHDPHSGGNKLRLKSPVDQICFTCHEEKKNELNQYTRKHKPASEGQCITCHSPHYSEIKYLLLDEIDTLCYNCHKENIVWKERRFQHGPVAQGNCTACHNPHGSDNAFILRLSFPHKFYTPYEKGKYNLCFLCHKEALVTTEKTRTATSFRNGDINLHRLHVNQQKGRTCRACHDIHASDQEDHLREEFPFGSVNIPIYYFKTETGGRCIPGCHKERGYDRVNKVENRN
ncbi:MAG TPA: cytochrome C [Nitrospirae bacterium]|nr:doubled CXXCH motif [bacterium BMS3Abin06]HDH11649.1 cytochrome C [Nitrospirota bacterium]HDZ02069.1 cytochrome C [Nitrospirota bacterium]